MCLNLSKIIHADLCALGCPQKKMPLGRRESGPSPVSIDRTTQTVRDIPANAGAEPPNEKYRSGPSDVLQHMADVDVVSLVA